MPTESFEVTILMPCLNEELTLGTCIKKALQFIEYNNIAGEILIADNGSTDRSIEIAQQIGARVVSITKKGYGSALHGGIKAARGKYIIMGDSDDSYNFAALLPFLIKLRAGADLVMGNRFKGGIAKGAMPFLHKYLGNPVLSFIGRLFFRIRIKDFHCGLRGFNRDRILSVKLNTTGMEFASEMIVKASLNKFRIEEVPTTLSKDGRDRKPHLRTWHDGWRHLRFLLIYSPSWLFLYPGLVFLLVGLITTPILLFAHVKIDNMHFDVHTLLYAASSIFIGAQLTSFFIFSKVYGGNNYLLPRDATYQRITKLFKLESAILIGLFLILLGITLTSQAVFTWYGTGFGNLSPSNTLRVVIPAVISLILGIQIIQTGFFISMLSIPVTTDQETSE